LKGSIYCGECGSRLLVSHAKGRGGIYPYFTCFGRQEKRPDCNLRAIRIELAEEAIADYYATIQLPAEDVATLRAFVGDEMSKLRLDTQRERKRQNHRLAKLTDERKKLLEAHYADAIPLDLLKSEQQRLTREINNATTRLAEIEDDFATGEANLHTSLLLVGDCHAAYRDAPDQLRRQFNLAFFTRLLIGDDYDVTGELAPPFDTMLGDELRQAARQNDELNRLIGAKEPDLLSDSVDDALRPDDEDPEDPDAELALATGAPNPGPSQGRGLSTDTLVRPSGLEPPRGSLPTRPST
jgi:hypothetical protein